MEKHLPIKLLKIVSFFTICFYASASFAQGEGTGNNIEYQQRLDMTVRGDMQVIGNNIIGLRGNFDGTRPAGRRRAIDEYNGVRNNGGSGNPTQPIAAYIDIDSNRSDPRFAPLFNGALPNSETDYTGNVDANGRPIPVNSSDDGSTYTGTFNSSASRLDIDPNCGKVVKAYLYWAGIYTTDGTGLSSRNPFCNNDSNQDCADYTEIKILPPGGTRYYDISHEPLTTAGNPFGVQLSSTVVFDGERNAFYNLNQDTPGQNRLTPPPGDPTQDRPYSCRSDVTEIFTELQNRGEDVSGWWTVANIPATTGTRGRGTGAGWTLAVVYENERETNERRIFFFDGFSYISNLDRGLPPIEFNVGPFTPDPNANPINATIASAGLEGDRDLSGDQFTIQTPSRRNRGAGAVRLEESALNRHHIGAANVNSEFNFFNSTITNVNVNGPFRQPNSSNTLGFDTDQYNLSNANNRVINNSDTEATFRLFTTSESFGNHFVAFAIDVIGPNLTVLKQALRGGTILTQNGSQVGFGQELTYRLTLRNVGNDDATEVSLTDYIPANTQLLTFGDGSQFRFNGLPPGFPTPTIATVREDAPNSITNFPFETDRVTITDLPTFSRIDCTNCETSTSTQEVIIEFRVRVIEECSPQRNACYDQVSNFVEGTFNGQLFRRAGTPTDPLFQLRSAFAVDNTCNSLMEGPTIQLPNRVARCTSEIGTICDQGGQTNIEGSLGFERYNLYFYPASQVFDASGDLIDTNGNGRADDADYPVDATRLLRTQILAGSPSSSNPVFTSLPNTSVVADAESFTIMESGYYLIESINDETLPCSNGLESFVVDLFDATLPINRPLENPSLNGVLLPECTINNQRMVQFEICDAQFEITTNYPRDTRLVWSRVDPTTCTTTDNPQNCPITGPSGCRFNAIKTVEDTVPGDAATENIMITETGDYSLTATLENGGCTETFFFRVIDFQNNLDTDAPDVTACNETPTVNVTGTSNIAGTLSYRLIYAIDDPSTPVVDYIDVETDTDPTLSTYGNFIVPEPAVVPSTVNVRITAIPISSTATVGTTCEFEFFEAIQFVNPEITNIVVTSPTCAVDQTAINNGIDESRGSVRVNVSNNSEEYTYVLIDTNGTPNNEADDIFVRRINTNINTNDFNNLDPSLNYKVRVYFNGQAAVVGDENFDITAINTNPNRTSATPSNVIASGCVLEELVPAFSPVQTYTATIVRVRDVTCEPGVITVNITANPGPLPADATFTIEALGINGFISGRPISIQDESLRPASVPEDGSGVSTGVDDTRYFDFSTITTFDVEVDANGCNIVFPNLANPLTPYLGLQITEASKTDVSCNGGTDGQFTLNTTDLVGNTVAPGRVINYRIISGNNTSLVYPIDSMDETFTNLPAGTFQVIARDITDSTFPCESEPIGITLMEPNPLLAPTITVVTAFDCNNLGSITVSNPTDNLGGTQPYRFQLLLNGVLTPAPTPPATNSSVAIANLPFTGLSEGAYTVAIVDSNGCPIGPVSNEIVFRPLSDIVTFVENPSNPITCDASNNPNETTEISVTATATNGGTIGYEITRAAPTVNPPVTTIVTSSTDGRFNLPEGNYTIQATTSSGCTDTIEVVVEPILRINIASLPNPNNVQCLGDTSGTTVIIENVIPAPIGTGYTYELMLGTNPIASNSSIVPVTQASIDLVNLAPSGSETYTFTVTDAFTGCSDSETFTVGNAPPPPVAVLDEAPAYSCTGPNAGTYTFSVEGRDGTGLGYVFSITSPTAIPVNSDGVSFTVPAPTSGSVTYQVSVEDSNCPGQATLPVTVDVIENFSATLNASSNSCVPTAAGDPNLQVIIDVAGTANFSYQQVLNGTNIGTVVDVTSITGTTGGQITIDLATPNRNIQNNYEFIIFDENHDNLNCAIRVPFTVNQAIAITPPNRVQPTCTTAGALPTNGASVSFSVTGGTGVYNYEVFNTTTSTDITGQPSIIQSGTMDNPTFTFSDAFNGQDIEIRITDNNASPCNAPGPVTFTPTYPVLPIVTSEIFEPAKCAGGASRLLLNLDLSDGSNITDYEYTFNGVAATTNELRNPSAGTVNYTVRRITGASSNCEVTGSVTIQEPSPIGEVSRNLVSPSCDPTNTNPIPGSVELTISGGFIINPTSPIQPPFPTPTTQAGASYDFSLRELSPMGTRTAVPGAPDQFGVPSTTTGSTVNFANLDAGTYEITATLNDGDSDLSNNCSQVFTITLPPEPFVNVVSTQFDSSTCVSGVDLYALIDGGADPNNFSISVDRVSSTFISPSATNTDFIARLGDSDFLDSSPLPAGITIPAFNTINFPPPPAMQPTFATDSDPDTRIRERFFRFTGLPPGGEYRITVRDIVSMCQTTAIISAPPVEDLEVTNVTSTNTGDCTTPSGAATVVFNITDDPALLGDYTIQLQRAGLPDNTSESVTVEVVDPSTPLGPNQVTGTRNTSVSPSIIEGITVTLENLPEILATENAILKVSQVGSDCSDVSDRFTIDRDPPINNFIVNATVANCNNTTTLTASATGGNGMYSYLVRNESDPDPALTAFPTATAGSVTIDIPVDPSSPDPRITLAGASPTPPNLFGTVAVYVTSGSCIEREVVNILFDPSPVLTLGTVVDECVDAPSYTVNYSVTNYDPSQSYNLLINGSTNINVPPGSLTIVPASSPVMAEGQFTVNDGRRDYNVELSGSTHSSCTSTDSFIIFPVLEVNAVAGTVDCENNISGVTANVNGGFTAGSRTLTYQLFEQGVATAINTEVRGPATTINDSFQFTDDSTGNPLRAGVNYFVTVTDNFGTTSAPNCMAPSNVVNTAPIIRSVPDQIEVISEVTCPSPSLGGTNDASIRLVLSTPTIGTPTRPVTFELYEFNTLLDANNFIVTNPTAGPTSPPATTGIPILPVRDNVFENLEEGVYVGFVINNGCYTVFPQPVELTTTPYIAPNITATAEPGTCNPTLTNPFIRISVNDLNGDGPFFYRITPEGTTPTASFVEIEGTRPGVIPAPTLPIIIDVPSVPGRFNVELMDSRNPICGPDVIVDPIIEVEEFILPTVIAERDDTVGIANGGAYSCTTPERVRVTVTGNVGDAYDIEAIPLDGSPATISTPNPITGVVIAASGDAEVFFEFATAGRYEFMATSSSSTCNETSNPYAINELDQIRIRVVGNPTIRCEGDADQAITFGIEDYIGFVTYEIRDTSLPITNPPVATATVNVTSRTDEFSTTNTLGVGDYEITVTATNDATGTVPSTNTLCAAIEPASIGDANALVSLTINPVAPVTCANIATTIQAVAMNGQPPYEFRLTSPLRGVIVDFSPANPTPNTSGFFGSDLNLGAETYTVEVRDANGCSPATPTTVTPTELITIPTIDNIAANNPVCNDINIGTIVVGAALNNPGATMFTYTLLSSDDAVGTNLVEVTDIITTANTHTFNAISGEFGDPSFYIVEVSDEFGCSVRSAVQAVEKPELLVFNNAETITPISCEVRDPIKGETELVRISARGGTPIVGTSQYTIELLERNTDGTRTEPVVVVETGQSPLPATLNPGEFELLPGMNYFRVTDANSCTSFLEVNIGDVPSPIDFQITPLQANRNVLCFGETSFVNVNGSVSGGVSGYGYSLVIGQPNGLGGFTEIETVVDEAGTNISTRTILSGAMLDGVTRFDGLRSITMLITDGTFPANATYLYKVTSGNCPAVYRPFEILERGEITVEPVEVREPSCMGAEDAEVTITIGSGDDGSYDIVIIREEGGVFDVNVTGVARLLNVTALNREVTFSKLLPGNYELLVSGNNCPLESISFTIDDKTEFRAVEVLPSRVTPECFGDPSSFEFQLSGGTPPYFYRVLDLGANPPDEVIFPEIDVWGNPNVVLNDGDLVTINADNNGMPFKSNNNYQIVFVDSGNEEFIIDGSGNFVQNTDASGDTTLVVCEAIPTNFNFDVPDLSGFRAEAAYVCETNTYDVTILDANNDLVEENITYIILNTTLGSTFTSIGENVVRDVPPGDIEVSISYSRPDPNQANRNIICNSLPGDTFTDSLEDIPALSFLRQVAIDENGDPVIDSVTSLPTPGLPYEFIGLNEYRITATGGVGPYRYEVRNINTNETLPVTIDGRGRGTFTIEETGLYIFSIVDSNGCTDFTEAEVITFIDITIPNVFNPASNNPEVNRWYPDNLVFGDIPGFPSEGIIVEEGSRVITVTVGGTTTGGTVTTTGGNTIITGGVTTGGTTITTTLLPDGTSTVSVTTGGTVTGGIVTNPIPVPGSPGTFSGGTTSGGAVTGGVTTTQSDTGVITSAGGNTVIRTIIDGPAIVTNGSGVTTGGTVVETTTQTDGTTTLRVIEGSTVTGATVTPEGVLVGGNITGGTVTTNGLAVPAPVSGETVINPEDEFIDFNNIDVMVFDRYGRLLEQFKGIRDRSTGEGWDGTYQGNNMPTGDYWYLIKLNDSRGREITGHFTLYRSK